MDRSEQLPLRLGKICEARIGDRALAQTVALGPQVPPQI